MRIAVVTWGEEGKKLYELLEASGRAQYEIRWIAEENSAFWRILETVDGRRIRIGSMGGAVRQYREGKIEAFLIPSLNEKPNGWTVTEKILQYGIPETALLYAPVEIFRDRSRSAEEKIAGICPYEERTELDFLEMHVADHCNLNCKNCSMFSGLVKGEIYSDYRKTRQGLLKLKEYITHVKVFRILGGEPLLNDQLADYLYLVRGIFPYADIRVITNGILVRRMSDELIRALRENRVSFIVTGYPALEGILDETADFLREKGIRHVVGPTIKQFQKIYNFGGDSDIRDTFSQCNWRGTCANIKENRIAACFVPFVFPYLAEQFGLELPEDETLDLFQEGLTAAGIRKYLEQPMELCRYCAQKGQFVEWERMDKESMKRIEDWA